MSLPEYEKIEKRTAEERIALITKWASWFYVVLDSWSGEIGMQLAYLWPAIAKGTKIECYPKSDLVQVLIGRWGDAAPLNSEIWDYIDIMSEDGKRFTPQQVRKE